MDFFFPEKALSGFFCRFISTDWMSHTPPFLSKTNRSCSFLIHLPKVKCSLPRILAFLKKNQRKGNCVPCPQGKSPMVWAIRLEREATDKESKQQMCQPCKPHGIQHSSSNQTPAYGFGIYPAHLSIQVTAQDDSCILYILSVKCKMKMNLTYFSLQCIT